jgi:hypothetical protein
MNNLRTLGIHGKNLPAKKTLTVTPSDFSIGGVILDAERRYLKAFKVSSYEEYTSIFGLNLSSTQYGNDFVKSFFDNAVGVSASLYVQTQYGCTTPGALDAVNAERDKANAGADTDALKINTAYQDNLQYGTAGNRVGTKITAADRFTTAAAGNCAATGVSYATLNSVIGIKVGDLILFHTGALGAFPVYKIVTQVDESARKVYWSGNFEVSGGSGETLTTADVVVIPGFKIQTYYLATNGVVTEVDTELGKVICSTESAVTDFFVDNIFKSSNYIKCTYVSAATLGNRILASDSNITYPTNGADGTAISVVAQLDLFLAQFNGLPIRFLAYPESTSNVMQKELITYSLARDDNPIVILNCADTRTKAQLLVIGADFQISGYAPYLLCANWLYVSDPFASSPVAPFRKIPNSGAVMGVWIRSIGQLGVHYIAATNSTVLNGVQDVVGDQMLNDNDRTDLANAGVNVIQNLSGIGIKIANLFAMSTDPAYMFATGVLMRNYIKVSAVDSLSGSVNTPNSINRIRSDKMAILTFLYGLWFRGSTGSVPEGETFGQSFNSDGTATKPTDHIIVIADLTNNPQAQINLGERNVTVYFTSPPPAGSIEIGVGILLR